jgi:hypothetical protein
VPLPQHWNKFQVSEVRFVSVWLQIGFHHVSANVSLSGRLPQIPEHWQQKRLRLSAARKKRTLLVTTCVQKAEVTKGVRTIGTKSNFQQRRVLQILLHFFTGFSVKHLIHIPSFRPHNSLKRMPFIVTQLWYVIN